MLEFRNANRTNGLLSKKEVGRKSRRASGDTFRNKLVRAGFEPWDRDVFPSGASEWSAGSSTDSTDAVHHAPRLESGADTLNLDGFSQRAPRFSPYRSFAAIPGFTAFLRRVHGLHQIRQRFFCVAVKHFAIWLEEERIN